MDFATAVHDDGDPMRLSRRAIPLAALVMLVAPQALAADATITFPSGGNNYSPASVRITPGGSVTWNGPFDAHPLHAVGETFPRKESGTTFTHSFADAGRFAFYCEFHGTAAGGGMAGTVTVTANTPPTASFTAPSTAAVGESVTFDGSGSSDPDAGQTLSYAWDLDGDQQFDDATTAVAQRAYGADQTVTVRLRVTDSNADAVGPESGTAARTLTVGSPPPATTPTATTTAPPPTMTSPPTTTTPTVTGTPTTSAPKLTLVGLVKRITRGVLRARGVAFRVKTDATRVTLRLYAGRRLLARRALTATGGEVRGRIRPAATSANRRALAAAKRVRLEVTATRVGAAARTVSRNVGLRT